MRTNLAIAFAATLALAFSSTAVAQNVENTESYEWVMSQEVPVTDGDITDRPYRVVGKLTKKIRRLTIFSKHSSPQKVYRELWEKARNKYKADAVIFANFGEAGRVQREARGTAIRFLTGEELQAWRARNSD